MSQPVEDMHSHRPKCAVDPEGHEVSYFSEPDAFACINCDRWLEPQCADGEHCMFCRARPERPSDLIGP